MRLISGSLTGDDLESDNLLYDRSIHNIKGQLGTRFNGLDLRHNVTTFHARIMRITEIDYRIRAIMNNEIALFGMT
jgi:hypothetical protein